ncbi:MAG: hypothetical protein BGO37_15505 [Cellulomonas sp. 73-92]|uniref:hypothetical protein n=1 Tax=Cellulomonas sp. 73-92 TaxID=1895740 RepID=UPI00092B6BB9|nr:hypothetical protein [Cellulomonas sp. 73-92]OJV80926.1 MAG: hypothetical protein BGO37_15505 [Cellulomonas sp. 73-92]
MASSPLASLPALRALSGTALDIALRQDAVATTAQLESWGLTQELASRRARDGEWQRVFRGVFVLQSGASSWRQQARAALLYAGRDAALSHRSAAFVRDVLPTPGPEIHVTVPHARTVSRQPGLVVHRTRHMPWAGGVLRAVDEEEAVLGLVSGAATEDELVGLVCDAVRGGARPDVLALRMERRPWLRHRALLAAVVGAVAEGIESPLEHRYRRDVEGAHGLPRAVAQRREQVDGRWIRADRVYDGFGVRVELDGQLAHPFGATDNDVWRDNGALLTSGDITLRYRWRHVAVTPCEVARQVTVALRAGGWRGTPRPCGARCSAS